MLRMYVTLPAATGFYSYIKRISDGLFWDEDDETFKAFASLVDGKVDFVEDSDLPGEYSWERDIPDGTYVVYTRRTSDDEAAAQAKEITIKFGNVVTDAKIINTAVGAIDIEILASS